MHIQKNIFIFVPLIYCSSNPYFMKNYMKLFAVFAMLLLFVQSVAFAHNAPPDNAPPVVYVSEPAVCFMPIVVPPKPLYRQASGSATLQISITATKTRKEAKFWYGLIE